MILYSSQDWVQAHYHHCLVQTYTQLHRLTPTYLATDTLWGLNTLAATLVALAIHM